MSGTRTTHRVRKISPDGIITTVAGNGSGGFQGDGGPATEASLYYPKGVAVDASSGNLYIADWLNSRIRVVTPDGNIYTVAGNGSYEYYGDGGPATSAALRFPWGVAVDAAGKVYVADDENSTIRLLTPVAPLVSAIPNALPRIDASGVVSDSSFGGFSSVAPGTWIEIHGSNLASDSRAWTLADFHGALAPTSLDGTAVTIGGHAAFLSYVSPTQIDAQIPSDVGVGSPRCPRDHRRRIQRSPDDYRESSSTGLARSRFAERRRQAIYRSAFYGRNHLRPPSRSDAQRDRSSRPPRGDDRSLRSRVWQGDSGPRRRQHRGGRQQPDSALPGLLRRNACRGELCRIGSRNDRTVSVQRGRARNGSRRCGSLDLFCGSNPPDSRFCTRRCNNDVVLS